MHIRDLIRIVENLYEDEPIHKSSGSFGWWIYPDGLIEEMEASGNHGITADAWLSNHHSDYKNTDYDEAIEMVLQQGGVRVSTFHGSDSMHLRFGTMITSNARSSLLKLMKEIRNDFREYFIGDEIVQPVNYRDAVVAVRKL